ncbi:MAG TPA: hemerythrin domain-containing protein [Streptosporangiaceae bacterium]|nr:hemerythrin domain-containing protein [Streptosporangiaceae bacterium]
MMSATQVTTRTAAETGAGSPRLPEWAIMYALHDAFRRDLDALLDTSARPAIVRARWAVFRGQLRLHHIAEDRVMWPPARARLAGDPDGLALLDVMEDEHLLIDPLLTAVDDAVSGDVGYVRLTALLAELRTTLVSHLAHEEAEVLPLVSRALGPAGVAGIFAELGKMGGWKLGAAMFPWALSGTSAQTQAQVLGQLPATARLLYRTVWFPRYRRMIPSL